MGYAKHVGRVGALAVALGVGAAVATTPGVAWADTPSSDAPADNKPAPNDDEKGAATTPAGSQPSTAPGPTDLRDAIEKGIERTTERVRRAVIGVVQSSGGAITSTHRTGTKPRTNPDVDEKDPVVVDPAESGEADNNTPAGNASPPATPVTAQRSGPAQLPQVFSPRRVLTTIADHQPVSAAVDNAKQQAKGLTTPTRAPQGTPSSAGQQKLVSAVDDPEPVEQARVPAVVRAPLNIVTNVLSAALAPFLGAGTPGQPEPQSPVLWAVLAWVRRQVQETPFGKVVLNRTPEITTSDVEVVDNGDGTFTITPSVTDPDGDDVFYTVTPSAANEGTVTRDPVTGKYTYKVVDDTWDNSDTVTVTVSDATSPHVHGLLGFFAPGGGHTSSVVVTIAPSDGTLPPPPNVVVPPTKRDDDSGIYDTVLKYDTTTISEVKAAPGFEPKYWRVVSESYDPITGEYKAELVPTQAGMLRAALGLDTKDDLKLQVTPQPTAQTFAFRSASFAALEAEDPPDQALRLPTPPASNFVIDEQAIPVGSKPAGVIVTDKYAYVLNSKLDRQGGAANGTPSTVTVIGADPANVAEYNKVVTTIPVGVTPIFAGVIDDRLYVVNSSTGAQGVPSTITVIDTNDNVVIDADQGDGENDIDAIALPAGAVYTVMSPDGKRMYVFDQNGGKVFVVDTDKNDPDGTYNQVLDLDPNTDGVQGIDLGVSEFDEETETQTRAFPISGALNADGSRLYVMRDITSIGPNAEGDYEVKYDGEVVVIDTASNRVIGDPVPIGQFGSYAASNGNTLYIPTLDLSEYDFSDPNVPPPPGYVTVLDIQTNPDEPTVVDLDPSTPELDRLDAGKLPYNIVYSPDRSLAYVISTGTGTVMVIDTANNELIDLDGVAPGVQGIVYNATPSGSLLDQDVSLIGISPDGKHLYITNHRGDTVTALSFQETPVVV